MKTKILIADDEPQIRLLLSAILREHEIVEAETGTEALAFCLPNGSRCGNVCRLVQTRSLRHGAGCAMIATDT